MGELEGGRICVRGLEGLVRRTERQRTPEGPDPAAAGARPKQAPQKVLLVGHAHGGDLGFGLVVDLLVVEVLEEVAVVADAGLVPRLEADELIELNGKDVVGPRIYTAYACELLEIV